MSEIADIRVPRSEGEPQKGKLWNQFTQQRLRAWQPNLAPGWIITIYVVCGVVFMGLGIGFLFCSASVTELFHDYTDESGSIGEVGFFDMQVTKDMEPPIWIFYQLDGFHQNHRRYVKSRDENQLQEVDIQTTAEADYGTCQPWVMTEGRVNYPCGLVAKSIFNDTFVFTTRSSESNEDSWDKLSVDSCAKTISWASDTDGKFHNLDPENKNRNGRQNQVLLNMWILEQFPPVTCEQKEITDQKPYDPAFVAKRPESGIESSLWSGDSLAAGSSATGGPAVNVVDCKDYARNASCNFMRRNGEPFTCEGNYEKVAAKNWGIENGHFVNWMRVAGLPKLQKLWGRVETPLKAGTTLRVHFQNNFPVKEFRGKKAIVLSTSSVLGGRNDYLGYGYLALGICCMVFGLAFLLRSPRPLGDVTLLCPRAS